jgi:ComF family protein
MVFEVPVPVNRQRFHPAAALARAGRSIATNLADLIIPPACLACHEPLAQHDTVCATCWTEISFIRQPLCDRLGLPLPFDTGPGSISAAAAANPPVYDHARAVAHYSGVMREMILAFKYGDTHNARKLFGRWLTSAGQDLIDECDVIAPVPMHPRRLLARRFNQAAILARELSRTSNRHYQPQLISRTRSTTAQVGLSSAQRRRNLAGAFTIGSRHRRHVEGRNILLVDDVITTGTTLGACAHALRRAGAARVDAVALAIVTDDSTVTL